MAKLKANINIIKSNYKAADSLYSDAERLFGVLEGLGVLVKKFFSDEKTDDEGNITSFFRSWSSKNRAYERAADNIHKIAEKLIEDELPLLEKYRTALQSIKEKINAFEEAGTKRSLADAMNIDNPQKFNVSGDGTSFFSITEIEDVEVIKFHYIDSNGKNIEATLGELIGANYTETGMAMSSQYAAALADVMSGGDGILSEKEQLAILNNTHSFVGDALGAGAFNVVSETDLKNVEASMNVDSNEVEGLKTKGSKMVLDVDDMDLGSLLTTNGVAVGMGMLSAYTLTDGFTNSLEKGSESATPGHTPTIDKPTTDTPQYNPNPSNPSGNNNPTNPSNPSGSGQTPEKEEQDTTPQQPTLPPSTVDDDDRLEQVEEDPIPEVITEPNVTPEDLDDLARDEYYEKHLNDLGDYRQQQLQEFEKLYNQENKEDLISKFKEMGYEEAEAIAAANNRDVGLSAFLLGSQNKELTDIANNFAKEYGLENFDTVYDDAPDFRDLYDGDAQASLSSPYENDAIVEAKEEVTVAKETYTESVATANSSIEKANKAKEELESVRSSIESKSGKDTSKWSEEEIERYNKATKDYNTAVTKANEDAAAAEAAKTTYDSAKANLEKAEDDYYNKIKNNVLNQNGMNNGGQSESLGQEVVGGEIPNNPTETGNQTGTTTQGDVDAIRQSMLDQFLN